jgi:hypothetical protein
LWRAADAPGLREARRVGDDEGHADEPRERAREQRLAAAGRPHEQHVGLVDLGVVVVAAAARARARAALGGIGGRGKGVHGSTATKGRDAGGERGAVGPGGASARRGRRRRLRGGLELSCGRDVVGAAGGLRRGRRSGRACADAESGQHELQPFEMRVDRHLRATHAHARRRERRKRA